MFVAARLLALMLLVFEVLVEVPPIFIRLHSQATWGAAAYNLAAIGACWIFAEFLMSRPDRGRIGHAGNVPIEPQTGSVEVFGVGLGNADGPSLG